MSKGYWRQVSQRALSASAKALRIETAEAVLLVVGSQAILALTLWYVSGDAQFWTRIATASLPFILLIPLYVWKFIEMPPAMAAETDVAHAAELEALRADKEKLEAEIAVLRAAPPCTRDPDGIYQHGVWVGYSDDLPDLDPSTGAAFFEMIETEGKLNEREAFEYQNLVLKISDLKGSSDTPMDSKIFRQLHNVTCRILGRR